MFTLRWFPVITLITCTHCGLSNQMDSNSYGPYKVMWKSYELCNGPKKENLTHISKSLLVENGIYKGIMNMTFPANTRIDEVKITVSAIKNTNTKNILWNYKVNQPCKHYAIAYVLAKHLGANNCLIKKGDYFCIVDFTDSAYRFFGDSFFYGDFLFKMMVLSKKGNIACIYFNPVFSKK